MTDGSESSFQVRSGLWKERPLGKGVISRDDRVI